jgi:outer membrane scaffolding protein for murein synthesis (MipA/OmpV family)
MPRLLPTFEIGPSLEWRLGELGGHWELRLPVRAAAAADLHRSERIGWLTYPHLRLAQTWSSADWVAEGAVGAGPLWASRDYHRYFYRVEPQYATPERPAYDPPGGYSGARATIFVGLRHGAWRVGFGISHDALAGAVMRESPLVETGQATSIAFGVFYTLWKRDWDT